MSFVWLGSYFARTRMHEQLQGASTDALEQTIDQVLSLS